jgi:hypothetical protein
MSEQASILAHSSGGSPTPSNAKLIFSVCKQAKRREKKKKKRETKTSQLIGAVPIRNATHAQKQRTNRRFEVIHAEREKANAGLLLLRVSQEPVWQKEMYTHATQAVWYVHPVQSFAPLSHQFCFIFLRKVPKEKKVSAQPFVAI